MATDVLTGVTNNVMLPPDTATDYHTINYTNTANNVYCIVK